MNRDQARQLVRKTFTHGFQKDQFRRFIRDLLNRYDENKAQAWNKQSIPHAFNEDIDHYERLGTYTSPDKEKLDILIVYLTQESKLERARTALRNFVAHHLKSREEKDAALVAFVSPTEKTWRFSFVRMEYETELTEAGIAKAKLNLTSARRFSYLVGEGESCHTAQSRFLDLLKNEASADPSLEKISESFSVETVTKEFFNRYYGLFQTLKNAVDDLCAKNKAVRVEFNTKRVNTDDFAKKLLGQIVFLYFIQKKGWLGLQHDQDWGSGPTNFLRRLALGEYAKFRNFFNDILEPLFYDTLATDRGDGAWCDQFKSRIPFLNGGLFEPLGGYDWKTIDLTLPDALFFNGEVSSEGDTGTGILDIFDRYNFTVNESEPLEQEVAIDPEMLGKVFENLLESESRKKRGTFYTPREIVHYMCQESLTNYLHEVVNKTKIALVPQVPVQDGLFGHSKSIQGSQAATVVDDKVSRQDLSALVHLGDQAAHWEAALKAGTSNCKEKLRPRLPKSIEEHAQAIDDALRDIIVCDPAIGSGAFPVGMMTEIVRARLALGPYFTDSSERTSYHFKRHAIQTCLYGVDLDHGAVEIAKLRLWLSLVVDEEDIQRIQPLPNLDYKVVTGDSLFGVEKNLFNISLFRELETLKPAFFDESDRLKKELVRRKIDDLIHQLSNGKAIFDFKIYFSEVFHRGGFDILIGNPPYLGFQGFMEMKDALTHRFKTAKGKFDYYIPFIERGLECLRPDGFLCFICPTNFMKRGYGKALRELLADNASIIQVCDFEDRQIFEGALNYTGVFMFQKRTPNNGHRVVYKQTLDGDELLMPQKMLSSAPWVFQDPASRSLIDKINTRRISRLEELTNGISEGIVTGQNEVFLLAVEKAKDLGLESELIRPCIRGRQIRRFALGDITEVVIYPYRTDGDRTIPIAEAEIKKRQNLWRYLVKTREKLAGRGYFEASTKHWYELWCQRDMRQLNARKIVVPELAENNRFSIAGSESFYGDTVCGITLRPDVGEDLRFVLGLLNSRLMEYVFKKTTVPKANAFYIYKTMFLKNLPIIRVNLSDSAEKATHDQLVKLTDRATAAAMKGVSIDSIEAEIDRLVYQLYDLNQAEIRMVEDTVLRGSTNVSS